MVIVRGHAEFKVGDVVQLRSGGGPKMTITGMSAAGIAVAWWRGATIQGGTFPPAALTLAQP